MFSIEFEEDPKIIAKLLSLGTKLPILKEFYPFIISDLNQFFSKSMILVNDGNIEGHVLLYNQDNSILYFGFFGVNNDEPNKITYLIDKIKEYAKEQGFSILRGPVNIPTIIFGWGFEEEGGKRDVFIQKPINHPKYIELFLKKDFYIKVKELSLEGKLRENLKNLLDVYNLKDYRVYHPTNWEEINKIRNELFALTAKNLSSSSQNTPGMEKLFTNYTNFARKYGFLNMFGFLKYIPSNELIGCFIGTPNPYNKNKNGKIESLVVYLLIVDKNHQGCGIGNYFTLYMLNKIRESGIKLISSTVESNNKVVINLGAKLGFESARMHNILEFKII